MKWIPDGPCAFQSEDGRFNVLRSPQTGYPATYTLVRLGTKRKERDGNYSYDGSVIVATETAASDLERKHAMDRLMEHAK